MTLKPTFFDFLQAAAFNRLGEDFVQPVLIQPLKQLQCAFVAEHFATELQVDALSLATSASLARFNGQQPLPWQATASVYSGHQFGHYNPRLGDGRAMLIGEAGGYEWQLKGAGSTPFSRQGDGRAVLRSSIRELLAAEALHALQTPTSRVLALFASREPVYRERVEPGAVVLRAANSFIRFGHFEYFYHTRQELALSELAEFTLAQVYPALQTEQNPQQALFTAAVERTARTIAHWQAVGFAHGVMNTDNMAISGETLDYGPYGFLDDYNPGFICNHSDHSGRYAFDQQPGIGLWNLNMLAHAFTPWVPVEALRDALQRYQPQFAHHYLQQMRAKLALNGSGDDEHLITEWLALLAEHRSDYTLCHRALSECVLRDDPAPVADLLPNRDRFSAWFARWRRAHSEPTESIALRLNAANPKYTLRNYLAQEAIEAAEDRGDWQPLAALYQVLSAPFDEHPQHAKLAAAPPDWGKKLEISCSS